MSADPMKSLSSDDWKKGLATARQARNGARAHIHTAIARLLLSGKLPADHLAHAPGWEDTADLSAELRATVRTRKTRRR